MSASPSLIQLQRAFRDMCLRREPARADLELLHGPDDRWLVYRSMVRGRLLSMTRSALPRSRKAMRSALGESAFKEAFSTYLEEDYLGAAGAAEAWGSGEGGPGEPHTRYFREVMSDFAEHLADRLERSIVQSIEKSIEGGAEVPAYLPELLRYEGALWVARWIDRPMPEEGEVVDFDLHKVPVANPTLRVLEVRHAVHNRKAEVPPEGRYHLAVYRRPDDHRSHSWALNEIGGKLLLAWSRGDRSAAEGAKSVLEELEMEATPRFVEGMVEVLSDFIEQRILLGSRP